MKKMFLFLILTAALTFAQNQPPVASNLTFAQRTDGSYKVDIYYDVTDADGDQLTITILASNDAGTTWDFAITSVTGDVGTNITSGTQKHIVWDFDADHTEYYSNQIKLKIIVDDNIFDACEGILTVNYFGKIYNTISIGTQCWLKENLDVGTMIYGAYNQTDNGTLEKYCYNNIESNCTIYGGLYQWREALQYNYDEESQGICPDGWHLPTRTELISLSNAVGNDSNNLKAVGQGNGEGAGSNNSGFTALLSGYRSAYGNQWFSLGYYSYYWSSTITPGSGIERMDISGFNSNINISPGSTNNYGPGFSIRCVKN